MPRYSAMIYQLHSAVVSFNAPSDVDAVAIANSWADTGTEVEDRLYTLARMDERYGDSRLNIQVGFAVDTATVKNVAEIQPGDALGNLDRVVYSDDEPRQQPTAAGEEAEERELERLGATVRAFSKEKGTNS